MYVAVKFKGYAIWLQEASSLKEEVPAFTMKTGRFKNTLIFKGYISSFEKVELTLAVKDGADFELLVPFSTDVIESASVMHRHLLPKRLKKLKEVL